MYALDTSVLIWGIQGFESEGAEGMASRAKSFLQHLEKEGETVAVPAPAVAEFLVGLPADQRQGALLVLKRNFFVPAFDFDAALVAADITPAAPEGEDPQVPKQRAKVDVMIAASAIAAGATHLVTHNTSDFARLSQHSLRIIEIPEQSEEQRLFEDSETEA